MCGGACGEMKYEIVFIEDGIETTLWRTNSKQFAAEKYNKAICGQMYVILKVDGKRLPILEADKLMEPMKRRRRWHDTRVFKMGVRG